MPVLFVRTYRFWLISACVVNGKYGQGTFFLCVPNSTVYICSVLLLPVRTAPSQELMKVTEVCYSVVR